MATMMMEMDLDVILVIKHAENVTMARKMTVWAVIRPLIEYWVTHHVSVMSVTLRIKQLAFVRIAIISVLIVMDILQYNVLGAI